MHRALLSPFLGCIIFTWACWQANASEDAADRPNIILLLADDLGWSDLACHGHPYHRTPHIDQLAQDGLRFTAAYAGAPICSASRASLLTGKTTARLNFEFVTKNEPGSQRLDVDVPLDTPPLTLNLPLAETTIAEKLLDAGYRTAFFGKWHLNQHYEGKYLAWHPDFGPLQQGFQTGSQDFGSHPYAWRGKPLPPATSPGQFPDDSMIGQACQFIESQKQSQTPYFLMVSTFYVHTPVKTRARWLVDSYRGRILQTKGSFPKRLEYAAFVELLDNQVGQILDAVEKAGDKKDTLVIFTSDNGGHPEFSANAPLRGSKWNLYEGGIRVPLLASWPGQIQAGSECGTPVIGYDLLPTLAAVAGTKANHGDGIDLTPTLLDAKSVAEPRPLVWHFPYYHPEKTYSKAREKIGVNDFAVSKTKPQSALRFGRHKLIHFAEHNRDELYDLSADISESHDLSNEKPVIRQKLRDLLDQQLSSMRARRTTPKHPAENNNRLKDH